MNFLKKNSIILLLAILALASFFRLWQIETLPPGLYPDEAINGMDALKTLETGQFKVFYPENNGREGLFIWLIALSFKLLGPSAYSIRLVSAILGILTVLALYLLTKELFNGKVALLSSFFLAVSFWHTNFSRIGFRAILVPLLMCFSFYFLFRAFRKKNLLDYIWAGIFFGLGFYTYIAFRAGLLILGVVILMKMIEYWQKNKPVQVNPVPFPDPSRAKDNKKIQKRCGVNWSWLFKKAYLKDGWWKVDLFLIIVIIIVLPIALYFFNQPQDFFGRVGGVSVFATEQPFKELGLSAIKTLGMFKFMGDWNWRHNYAGLPMLAWSTNILLLFGIVLTILSFLFSLRGPSASRPKGKKQFPGTIKFFPFNHRDLTVSVFLFSWFIAMLLPAIFTYEGIPHALRTIGVIPVVYIFAALGLYWLIDKFPQAMASAPPQIAPLSKFVITLLLILSLFQPALANFNKYFLKWASNPNVAGAFRQDLVDLAKYLNSLPEEVQRYVIVNESGVPVPYPDGLSMPAQTIIFESAVNPSVSPIKYLLADTNSQVKMASPPLVIVPLKYEGSVFRQLREKLPGGTIENINGFRAYKVQ